MNGNEVIRRALGLLDLPYQWGGSGPPQSWGIDCSGLVRFARRDPPPDKTAAMMRVRSTPVPPGQEQPGDLVFPLSSPNTHVALYVGADHADPQRRFIIIEAGGGDSTCTSIDVSRKKGACVRLRSWARLASEVRRWEH